MNEFNAFTSLTIPLSILRSNAAERSHRNKKLSLITTKHHPFLPLSIHNYNDKSALNRQLWDDISLAARSLITERHTGKVVSRSLPKFFNFHEKWAYRPTGTEYAWRIEEKVDGSLISLFWYEKVKEWLMVSKSAFENQSVHATSARRILAKKYPNVLDTLDKEMTYVFELVDPRLPIKVKYENEDLCILSIVSKDGKEPEFGFDWKTLPFPRPRIHAHDHTKDLNLKELSKLNLDNEEGFVVTFWGSPEDRHPRRVKVKFESYLDSGPGESQTRTAVEASEVGKATSKISSSSRSSSSSVPAPPTNARILEIYINHRLKIQHFKPAAVSSAMERHKQKYLQSVEPISDDYGSIAWLEVIDKTWDRIDAIFSLQEDEFMEKMNALQKEGYKPPPGGVKSDSLDSRILKERFEKRIKKSDVDPAFRDALVSWFLREPVAKQVGNFVNHLELPQDLRSEEVLKSL